MKKIQILEFTLTDEFNAMLVRDFGITSEQLLDKTTESYVSLWIDKYQDHENFEEMRKAEGINFTDSRANIEAFLHSASAETDTLQSGGNKTMYVAWNPEAQKVEGLIQLSNFNYTNFAEKRYEATVAINDKVNEHMGPYFNLASTDITKLTDALNIEVPEEQIKGAMRFTHMPTTFENVVKPQREYHSSQDIGYALLRNALLKSKKTSSFIVSYDGAETEIGYENVAETTTMDSGTACYYMVGKNDDVALALEEKLKDSNYEFDYAF